MRPDSYCKYPRRCQNCRHVSLTTKTSFFRKGPEDDIWCCGLLEKAPQLPPGVHPHVKYLSGYLSNRAVAEGRIPPLPPELDPETEMRLYNEHNSAFSKWLEENKVSSEGSCSSHEFNNLHHVVGQRIEDRR